MTGRSRRDSVPSVHPGAEGRCRTKKITHTSRIRKSRPKTPAPTSSFHSSHLPQWIKHKKVTGKKKNVSKSATWTIEMEEFIQGPKSRNTNTSGRGYGDSGNHSRQQRKRRGGVRGKRGGASASYSIRVAYAVGVADENGAMARAAVAGASDTTTGEPRQQQFFELVAEQWGGGGGGGGGGGAGGLGGGSGGRGKGGDRRGGARPAAESSAGETAGYSMAALVRPMSPESKLIISTAMFSSAAAVAAAAAAATGGQTPKGTPQNKGFTQTSSSGAGDSGQFVSFVSSFCSSPNATTGAPNQLAQLLPVLVPPASTPSTVANSPTTKSRASSCSPAPPVPPSSSSSPSLAAQAIPLPPPPASTTPSESVKENGLGDKKNPVTQPPSPRSPETRSRSPKPPTSDTVVQETPLPTPRRRSTPSPTSPGKRHHAASDVAATQQQQSQSPTRRHSASPSLHADKKQISTERRHASPQNSILRSQEAQNLLKFESIAPPLSFLTRLGRGYEAQPTPRLPTTLPSTLPPTFSCMAHLTSRKLPSRIAPTEDLFQKTEVITPQLPLDAKSLLERPVLLSNMLVRSEDSLGPVPKLSIKTDKNMDMLITDQTYRVDYTNAVKQPKEKNEESFVVPKHKHLCHTEASQIEKSTHPSIWTEMTTSRPRKTKEPLKPSVNASSTPALTKQPSSSAAKKGQKPLKDEPELHHLFQRSLSSTSLSVQASSIASKKTLSSTSLRPYSPRLKHGTTENSMRKSAFVQTINKKKSRESNKMKKQQSLANKSSQPSTMESEKMAERNSELKESENSVPEKDEKSKQILNKNHINPPAETSKDVSSEIIDILPPASVSKSKEALNHSPVEEDPKCLKKQNKTCIDLNETQELMKSEERASESPQSILEEQNPCSDSLKKSESAGDVSQPLQPPTTSECLSLAVTVSPTTKEVQEVTSTSQLALPPSEHAAKISSSVTSTKSCLLMPLETEEPSTCAKKSDTGNVSGKDSNDSFVSETDKKSEETNKTYILSESKTYHLCCANEITSEYLEAQNPGDRTDISTSSETLKECAGKEEKITDEKLIRDIAAKTAKIEPSTPKIKDENVPKNTPINFPELQQIHDSLQNMTQFLSRRVEEVVSAVSLSVHNSRFANHSLSLLQRSMSESMSGDKSRPLSANAALFSTRIAPPSARQEALPMKECASFPQQVQQDHKCIPAADLEMSSLMVANMIGLLSDTISELTGIPIRMASEMIKAGSKMRSRLEAVKRSDHCANILQEKEESKESRERDDDAEGVCITKSALHSIKLDSILGGKEHRKSNESLQKYGKHDTTRSKNNERHRKHAASSSKRTSHRREKGSKASKKIDCAESKGVMTDEIQAVDKDVECHDVNIPLGKETCHEVPVKAQGETAEEERECELTNETEIKDDASPQVPKHEIIKNEENISVNLKCRYEKGDENSNLCANVSDITENKESHENSFTSNATDIPQNRYSSTQKLLHESAAKKKSKRSECNIEHTKEDESVLKHNRDGFNTEDESVLKHNRDGFNTEDISDPMKNNKHIMDDRDENNLMAHPNKNSTKPHEICVKCKVDKLEELSVLQSTGETNVNNLASNPTIANNPTNNYKREKTFIKCKANLLHQLKDYDSIKHEGNERVSDNAPRVPAARSKDGSQKSLLFTSQTKESHRKGKLVKHFSSKTLSENKNEVQHCDGGSSISSTWTHCTDITPIPLNNITRKGTHWKPNESFDGNRSKYNIAKDMNNDNGSKFLSLRNESLNIHEIAFPYFPSFDKTRDVSPTNYTRKKVHFDSNALGYRVPRKRTRVERTTAPITDNMAFFPISEKMKSPSSEATSDTSSTCSGRTVKEAVPKTNFNQSTNEITEQANIISVAFINKKNDEIISMKNNVTPDILLAPNKKSHENSPHLLSPHNPRPKSILTIPMEAIDSIRADSIVIRDQKNTDNRHESTVKQFPVSSKKKRKRLEFQRIPIRMRKRQKIPDSWNPLKVNIPTSEKFNIFQTCEEAKSMSEEKFNIIPPPKPEFKFALTHSRPTQSPRERKDKESIHKMVEEGEITENDRKMDFLIIEPPERDVGSKVYGPVMFSCKERHEASGFNATDSKRCSSPVRGNAMGLKETNFQNQIRESETRSIVNQTISYSTDSKGRVNVTLGKITDTVETDSKIHSRTENKYQIPSIVAASSICFSHAKNHEMKGFSSQYACGRSECTKPRTSSACTRGEMDRKNLSIINERDNLQPVRNVTISGDNIILQQSDITLNDEDGSRGKILSKENNERNGERFLTSITNRKENIPKEETLSPVHPMKEFKSSVACGMNVSLAKETDLNKAAMKASGNVLTNSIYKKKFIRFEDTQVEKPRSSLVPGQRRQEHQSTVCFSVKKESSDDSLQQFTKPRQKLHSTSTHSLFTNKYPHNAKDSERKFSRHRVKEVEKKADVDAKKTVKLGWSQAFDKYRSFQKSVQSVCSRDKFLFVKSVSENSFPNLDFPDPFEYSAVPNPLDIPDYLDSVAIAADDKVNAEISKTSIHFSPNKGKSENTKILGGNKQKRLTSATKTMFQVTKDDEKKTEIRKRRLALSPQSNHPRQWTTHLDNSPRSKFPFPKPTRREDKNIKECTWIVGGMNNTTDCKVGNFGALKSPTIRINTVKNGPCNSAPRGLRTRLKSSRSNKMFQEKVISMDINQMAAAVEMKHQEGETHAFLVRVKNAYSEEPKISLEHISSSKTKGKKRADVSPTAFVTSPKSRTGALWKEMNVEGRDPPVRKISVTCLPQISLATLENTLHSGRKSSVFSLNRCERKGSGQEARGEADASAHHPRRGSLGHLERSPPRSPASPSAPAIPSAPTPPGSAPNVVNAATSISRSLIHLSRDEQKKELDPRTGSKDRGPSRRSGVVWGRRWCKHRHEADAEGEAGDGEREGGGGAGGGAGGEGLPPRLAFCDSAGDVAGRKTPRVDQRLKEAVASRKRAWRPGSHTRRRGLDAACALRECKYLCSLAAVLDRLAAVYRETDEPAEDMDLDECPTEDEVTWDSSGCGVQLRQPSSASPMLQRNSLGTLTTAPGSGSHTVPVTAGTRMHPGRDRARGNRSPSTRNRSRIPVLARQQQPYLPQYPNDSWCFGLSE